MQEQSPATTSQKQRPSRGTRESGLVSSKAAKSYERKDSKTKATRRRQTRASTKAEPRASKAASRSSKQKSKATAASVKARRSVPLPRKTARQQELSDILSEPQLLSVEALAQHTRATQSEQQNRRDSTHEALYAELSNISLGDTEYRFNLKWGYLPPFTEEFSRILDLIAENPGLAKVMGRIGPEKSEFPQGLIDRGVRNYPCPGTDNVVKFIKTQKIPKSFLQETLQQRRCFETLWVLDQEKCLNHKSEALIQRTIVMGMIARHCLLLHQDKKNIRLLDYSPEEPWDGPPMPTKVFELIEDPAEASQKLLTQPKPDYSISFTKEALFTDSEWELLPPATKCLASYMRGASRNPRPFPFLSIEAKAADVSMEDIKGFNQSLNNASQALWNMYEFLKDAGPSFEAQFFKSIRFFSLVATNKGVLVRIHRALRLSKAELKSGCVIPKRPDYDLKYHYQHLDTIRDDRGCDRDGMLTLIRKLAYYGVTEMLPIFRSAANALKEKLNEDQITMRAPRQSMGFYRYGQPDPMDSTSSVRGSKAGSKTTSRAHNNNSIGNSMNGVSDQFRRQQLNSFTRGQSTLREDIASTSGMSQETSLVAPQSPNEHGKRFYDSTHNGQTVPEDKVMIKKPKASSNRGSAS